MAIGAPKHKYVYVDDLGNNWIINIASDRVLNVVPATGLTLYDPANPPTSLKGRLNPKRCRRVYAQYLDIRREFICNIGGALYIETGSVSVAYKPSEETATVTMTTTGRRGEKISF